MGTDQTPGTEAKAFQAQPRLLQEKLSSQKDGFDPWPWSDESMKCFLSQRESFLDAWDRSRLDRDSAH